jgi:D-beta-D-heptose 7-phosphate kinase/D-beta-D-heptose 1-phosphate adenosyltransferase
MHGLPQLLNKITDLRILVVGDVMLDHYVWGDATRISPEAPVPVVDIGHDSWTAGGAANVALNIASLGARCAVAGFIGKDEAGSRLRAILHERKIAIIPTPGSAPTILKTRVLVQRQQLCRLDREAPPTAYEFPAAKARPLLAKEIAACDAVILSDYAKGILSNELVTRVTELARDAGKFIALDPKPKRKLQFRNLDLITPNKREALQLAGIEPSPHTPFPAAEVCARLHELYGTRYLVITLGEDGMLLSTNGVVMTTIPTAARARSGINFSCSPTSRGLRAGCIRWMRCCAATRAWKNSWRYPCRCLPTSASHPKDPTNRSVTASRRRASSSRASPATISTGSTAGWSATARPTSMPG